MPDGNDPKALQAKTNAAVTAKNWQIDQRLNAYEAAGTLDEYQIERIIGFLDSQPEVALLVLDMLDQRRDGKIGTLELMPAAEFESMIAAVLASPTPPSTKHSSPAATCNE